MTAACPVRAPDAGLLARHELLRSTELDEVRVRGAQVFCEHQLRVAGRGQRLDTRLCFRRVGALGFGRMRYGAAVDIDPGRLDSFYLLQLPLCGHETIVADGAVVDSTPQVATLVSPSLPFRMHHGQHTEKLFLRIEREALERQLSQLGGRPPRGALVFAPGVGAPLAPGSALRRLLDGLFADADDETSLLAQPLVAARLQEALLCALLTGLPHNQAEALAPAPPALSPRYVRRALDFIEQHAHEPLTAAAIAAHAGVSVRSLFAGFRSYRGTTPMACLRALRLDRVRAELASTAQARGSVSQVALRWGFNHFGQFAAAYRRRFGELPSQTAARAART